MLLPRSARISLQEQRDRRQSVAMLIRKFSPEFKQECQAVGVQSLAWTHEAAGKRPCPHGVKAASSVDSSLEARPVKRVLHVASAQAAQHFNDCILADVRHEAQYASVLRANGVTDVQRRDSSITSLFFAIITLGSVRPFVLVGRKPSTSL